MLEFYNKYRDPILFAWGLIVITIIIFKHVVTQDAAYAIIAGAIGLPLLVEFKKGSNGKDKQNNE